MASSVNPLSKNSFIKSSPAIKLNRTSFYRNNTTKTKIYDISTITPNCKSAVYNSEEGNSESGEVNGCLRLRRYNKWNRPKSVKLNTVLSNFDIKSSADNSLTDESDNSTVSINSHNIKILMSCVENELKSKNEKLYKKSSSGEHKFKADIELSKLLYGESYKLNKSNEKKKEVNVEVEPVFAGHQLVGDSQLLRFSQCILGMQRKIDNYGKGWLGLCVGGQRICDLHKRVLEGIIPVSKKLIVLIGTNDLLKGTTTPEMCKGLYILLKTLLKNAEKIVLLTLPPIPRIAYLDDHWQKLKKYNDFIFSLKDLFKGKVSVVDISPLFYQTKLKKCHLHYFELWFEGPVKRPDLIHINESGFQLIKNELLKKI